MRVAMVVGLALMLVGACTDDGDGAGGDKSGEAVFNTVLGYVGALEEGDVAKAMSFQCTKVRASEGDLARLRDELARLQAEHGQLQGVAVERAEPTGLVPPDRLPVLGEVRYGVTLGGRRRGDLRAVVVTEDGRPRLCGRATESARTLHERLSSHRPQVVASTRTGRELLDIAVPAGYRLTEDEAAPLDAGSRPGSVEAWTRAWQPDGYGGIRVTATTFGTPDQALSAETAYLAEMASDAVAGIEDRAMPALRGLRVMAYAQLGVQPPELGPYVDFAYSVYGNVLVEVGVSNLPTGSDHALVRDLLRQVNGMAVA